MSKAYRIANSAGRMFRRLGKWSAVLATSTKDAGEWVASAEVVKNLNETFSSAVSKAMDEVFLKRGAGSSIDGLLMTPSNHRILDGGHGVFESLDRAFEVGEAQGLNLAESFVEWAKAYVTDLSSSAGMPIPGAKSLYEFMRERLDVSEETARDMVTVNGAEAVQALLSGVIASVALIFAWKTEDKEQFSRVLGTIGISSLIAMNPAAALVAVVGLALGYQKKFVEPQGIKRGVVVGAASIAVSAAIPGPVLLGAIPAVVISIYLQKKLRSDVPVEIQIKDALVYVRSGDFRIWVESVWQAHQRKMAGASSLSKAA